MDVATPGGVLPLGRPEVCEYTVYVCLNEYTVYVCLHEYTIYIYMCIHEYTVYVCLHEYTIYVCLLVFFDTNLVQMPCVFGHTDRNKSCVPLWF